MRQSSCSAFQKAERKDSWAESRVSVWHHRGTRESCKVSSQKPGCTDGQHGTAGRAGDADTRGALGAQGHRAGESFPRNQLRALSVSVRLHARHLGLPPPHLAQVWQNSHQGLGMQEGGHLSP